MALRIPNKDTLAARQNDAERFVVPGPKRASLAMKSVTDGSMFRHSSWSELQAWAIAIFQPVNAR